MSEFTIRVEINGDIGTLEWADAVDQKTLNEAISLASDDAILGHNVHRVEALIPAGDVMARRALQQAGFRREGIRRSAMQAGDSRVDVLLYARLAADPVYGPAGFSAVMDSVLPTKRVIGHVLFRDESGRVLLLRTSYKEDLELPGGVVEDGEPPRVGAEREVFEELALRVRLGGPAMVDWMPPYLGWSDAIEFIFDGGVMTAEERGRIVLGEPEIVGSQWVAPADLDAHVTQLSARRIRLLCERSDDAVLFTEAGYQH